MLPKIHMNFDHLKALFCLTLNENNIIRVSKFILANNLIYIENMANIAIADYPPMIIVNHKVDMLICKDCTIQNICLLSVPR